MKEENLPPLKPNVLPKCIHFSSISGKNLANCANNFLILKASWKNSEIDYAASEDFNVPKDF